MRIRKNIAKNLLVIVILLILVSIIIVSLPSNQTSKITGKVIEPIITTEIPTETAPIQQPQVQTPTPIKSTTEQSEPIKSISTPTTPTQQSQTQTKSTIEKQEPNTSTLIPIKSPASQVAVECKGTFQTTIERIIDGDTLVVKDCSESIRLSLVNTPEYYETGYTEANSFTANLCKVGSTTVIDQDNLQPYDKYGRMLASVSCQGKKLNAELIYNNLGIIDTRFCSTSEFANEDWAKNYGCGATQQPTANATLTNCFSIINFHYDAAGNDNYNLNDEYVTLKNICNFSIDMSSWTIKDEATHIYTFSTYIFNPQSSFTLYSGTGTDTQTELYWGRTFGAVWNNDADTLFLRDKNGNLIFSYSYP